MIRSEVHKVIDALIDEAEGKELHGQVSLVIHFQSGVIQKVSDERISNTHIGQKHENR